MSDQVSGGVSARGAQVIASTVVTIVLATIVVALRFITRTKILNFVGKEDWCIGVALLFSFGNSAGMIFQAEVALGKHIQDLSGAQITAFLKGVYFTIASYNISLTLAKISTLLLYLRIFNIPKMQKACYIQLAIVILYGLWAFFCSILACVPVAAFWDLSVKGKCLPRAPIWFTNAGINIATDIMILCSPMPVIGRLALPRRQKIGLYCVFALGFFVCIVSILRLHSLRLASLSTDPTWDNIGIANWSSIELNTAIICPSLTTLKPLISRLFPRLLSTANSRKIYHHYDSGVDVDNGHGNGSGNRKMFRGTEADHSESKRTLADSRSDTEILCAEEGFDLGDLRGGNGSVCSGGKGAGKVEEVEIRVVPL